ncbi:hypothetical protein RB195_016240 [Necator americanus]|uniref:SCP domain-containing protein n=1 Tax=Necator americanus TaxID=51031 RepID=A0ABR1E873_NECAM
MHLVVLLIMSVPASAVFDEYTLQPVGTHKHGARCFSCMSRLYEAVWPSLSHIYKRPRNFTDNCNDDRLTETNVPLVHCDTICVSMYESPNIAGVRIGGYIRGCMKDVLIKGFNETIVSWYRWMQRDSCRPYRKKELFKLGGDQVDESTIDAAVIGVLSLPAFDTADTGATAPMTTARNSLITDEWRTAVLNLHNDLRRKLAKGEQQGKAGKLPAAGDMNEINWDYNAEMLAQEEAKNCPTTVVPPEGYVAVSTTITTKKSCNATDETKKAIQNWWDLGAASQENNTIDANNTFSQLAYSQLSAVGCSYHACSSTQLSLICLYNNPIDENTTDLYTANTTGCACADCISYLCPSTFSPAPLKSTVCSSCNSSTTMFREAALYLHNYYRRLVASGWAADKKITYAKPAKTMMELTYDQTLEDAAIAYLNKTGENCPTGPENKEGENFWSGTDLSLPAEKAIVEAVGEWFAYLGNEGLGDNLDYSSLTTDSGKTLGNVIHDKTTKLGCAIKTCKKTGKMVIDCRYDPKLSSGKIYEIGTKECVCGTKKCSPLGGLCVA